MDAKQDKETDEFKALTETSPIEDAAPVSEEVEDLSELAF